MCFIGTLQLGCQEGPRIGDRTSDCWKHPETFSRPPLVHRNRFQFARTVATSQLQVHDEQVTFNTSSRNLAIRNVWTTFSANLLQRSKAIAVERLRAQRCRTITLLCCGRSAPYVIRTLRIHADATAHTTAHIRCPRSRPIDDKTQYYYSQDCNKSRNANKGSSPLFAIILCELMRLPIGLDRNDVTQ